MFQEAFSVFHRLLDPTLMSVGLYLDSLFSLGSCQNLLSDQTS